jgi:hypothetical protein
MIIMQIETELVELQDGVDSVKKQKVEAQQAIMAAKKGKEHSVGATQGWCWW